MSESDRVLAYLRDQLRDAAPTELTAVARFNDEPLHEEGPFCVFAFTADVGGAGPADYYAVGGRTELNYYPQWGLSADEIYRVHLGTRFMLVVNIARCPDAEMPTALDPATQRFLDSVAMGREVSGVTVTAAFRADNQLHAVYRLRIGSESVCVVGGDCPPGAYRRIDLPPQVVYRLHLGNVILHEADQDKRVADD